ncbi:MAG: hypothetical protein WAT39_07000 [Planctomycetota bacterium]
MANTYSDIIPKILGRSLTYLRANSLAPRIVNRDYDGPAAAPGSIINVRIPPTVTVTDVTSAATQPANVDTTWSTKPVALSFHREAPFHLTDLQRLEVGGSAEQMAVDSAIKALCDNIDQSILLAMDVGASIATGTAATTPFATLALSLDPLQYLDTHKTPMPDRHVMMSPRAQMNLLGLTGFTSRDYIGDVTAMVDGGFHGNQVAGAKWWMSQNVPTHTAGTGASYLTNSASLTAGVTTIPADTGTGTILAGDVVVFAGDAVNKYVVATALSGGSFTIAAPGLKVAIADNAAITLSATHVSNFAFQRESIVFASRPFLPSAAAVATDQFTDPVSGLTVRVEVTRQNKQDKWSVDANWGTAVVQPHGIIKVMG